MLKCRQPRAVSAAPFSRAIRRSPATNVATRCSQTLDVVAESTEALGPASAGEHPAGQAVARTAYRSHSCSQRRER